MKEMRGTLIDGAGHGTTAASEEFRHIVRCRGGRQNILIEGVEGGSMNHFLFDYLLTSRICKATISLICPSGLLVQGL